MKVDIENGQMTIKSESDEENTRLHNWYNKNGKDIIRKTIIFDSDNKTQPSKNNNTLGIGDVSHRRELLIGLLGEILSSNHMRLVEFSIWQKAKEYTKANL